MTGYTTHEVSEVLGLPTSTILSWTRAGLLTPARGPRGAYYYSFTDIALLRSARELLDADVSSRKVKQTLERLRGQLPRGRALSAVRLSASGRRILVRDEGKVWDAGSGQLVMDLEEDAHQEPVDAGSASPPPDVTALPTSGAEATGADDWYDAGVDLEAEDPGRAVEAYRRTLELDPTHAEAHLNLGRLLHEAGDLVGAEGHYRTALEADPGSARAFYNLGVVLEDRGREAGALQAYESALRLDPELAVAHFNASRLCEARGQEAEALGHLAAYKRILDREGPGV